MTTLLRKGLLIAAAGCYLPGCQQDAATPPTAAIDSNSATASPTTVQTAENDEPAEMPNVTGKPVSVAKPTVVEKNPEAVAAFEKLHKLMGEEWELAQAKILELGTKAFPVLNEGLTSTDSFVRETAAMLLAQMTDFDDATTAALKKALYDESAFVRANAAAALAQSPEAAADIIPVLTELLATGDANLKNLAAANLSSIGQEASAYVKQLTEALHDDDVEVVLPVVELLGRIGPKAQPAVSTLKQIAHDRSGDLRNAAVHAIEQIASLPEESAK